MQGPVKNRVYSNCPHCSQEIILCPICDKIVLQKRGQKSTYHKECKKILDDECERMRGCLSEIAINNIKNKLAGRDSNPRSTD